MLVGRDGDEGGLGGVSVVLDESGHADGFLGCGCGLLRRRATGSVMRCGENWLRL